MSTNTTYNIHIDSQIKKEADELYKNMGMSLSSDNIISEPLGEPPSSDKYNSFDSWEQAKKWLNA